ncbi:MAG: PorT family protein [Acidobacteria bacterium]|nr:PorT family protein [Acidobacteriota bacterium]
MNIARLQRPLACAALLALCCGTAHAGDLSFKFNLGGNMLASVPAVTGADVTPTGASIQPGAGVAVEVGRGRLSLDLGVSRLTRRGSLEYDFRRLGGGTIEDTTEFSYVEMPVLVRFHLGRVSLGAGGYVDKAVGTFQSALSRNLAFDDVSASGLKSTSMGLMTSLAVNLPVHSRVSVVLDSRYAHGLSDLSMTRSASWKTRDLQAFVGLRLHR